MKNRKIFRIVMAVACFIFAGAKLYNIARGNYEQMDLFFLAAFLLFGIMYLIVFWKERKQQ